MLTRRPMTRKQKLIMWSTALVVVLIGLFGHIRLAAGANCPAYIVQINNPNGEGDQGMAVATLTLCPGTPDRPGVLTLEDFSDDTVEPKGRFQNPGENGSYHSVMAQTVGLESGYWVELKQDGLDQPRCFKYSPSKRWKEYVVPEGESSLHCYQLSSSELSR